MNTVDTGSSGSSGGGSNGGSGSSGNGGSGGDSSNAGGDLPRLLTSLVVMDVCPGTSAYGDCYYPRTPRANENSRGMQWSCQEGSFCISPDHSEPCSPGFYCPVNTAQPIYCPPRYYCSLDTTTITRCPAGFYCKVGTVRPLPCVLASCPEGTETIVRVWILAVFALFFGVVLWTFFQRNRLVQPARAGIHLQQLRELRRKQRLQKTNGSSSTVAQQQPSFTVTFQQLGKQLRNGTTVLHGVGGTLQAGRTCAVLGPSGAGKTTFLSVLMGKVKRSHGLIQINGQPGCLSSYRKLVGYVPQEDVMLRELTVRDILMHSARMRLPRDWSQERVQEHVLETIDFLGLADVMDCVVGDDQHRGISGGQRKRVNIGMELVADPAMLFLDEVTSGLDSSIAHDICKTLQRIAHERHLLVVSIIHSPNAATFHLFDDVLLLGKGGRTVYFGPTAKLADYLECIGFPCPPNET